MGADTATKKRLDSVIIDLGAGSSIDVTQFYSDYTSLTVNNFYVCASAMNLSAWGSAHGEVGWQGGSAPSQGISKSYNSKTGQFSVSGTDIFYDYNKGDYNPHVSARAIIDIRTFLIVT